MIDDLTGVKSEPKTTGSKKQHGKHEKETDDEHAHRVSFCEEDVVSGKQLIRVIPCQIIGGHKANINNPNTCE